MAKRDNDFGFDELDDFEEVIDDFLANEDCSEFLNDPIWKDPDMIQYLEENEGKDENASNKPIDDLKAKAMVALYLLEKKKAKQPKTLVPNPPKMEKATKLMNILKDYVQKCHKMGCEIEFKTMQINSDYYFELLGEDMARGMKPFLQSVLDLIDGVSISGATEERAKISLRIDNVFTEHLF